MIYSYQLRVGESHYAGKSYDTKFSLDVTFLHQQ